MTLKPLTKWGIAMVQAVSRWPFTSELPLSPQASPRGIYDGSTGTEKGFLRILRFSLVIIFPPMLHAPSSITDVVKS